MVTGPSADPGIVSKWRLNANRRVRIVTDRMPGPVYDERIDPKPFAAGFGYFPQRTKAFGTNPMIARFQE